MLTWLRRLYTWWDEGVTVSNALGLLLILAVALNFAADAGRRMPDSLWYALADNLFIACAGIGFALAVLSPRIRPSSLAESWPLATRLGAGAVLGGGTLLAILGAIRAIWGGPSLHDLVVSAALGIGVGLLALTLARPANSPDAEGKPALAMTHLEWAYGALAVALIAGVVGRSLAPGSTVQTWIIAPFQVLVAPGIGLGLALLPRELGWPERAIAALPLGVAAQLIGLMWCDLLGVPAGRLTFTVIGALATFGGLIVDIIARRHMA